MKFHLGDIISVTTGILVAPNGMGGVQEFLEYMAGEPIWTHQLPRVSRECKDTLRAQFPAFADLEVPQLASPSDYVGWLETQAARFGAMHEVAPLNAADHTSIDPITEMQAIKPGGEIVAVSVED
jgi:hypothetical protein